MENQITCPDATIGFLSFFDFSIAPPLLFYSYIPIVLISLLLSFFILSKDRHSLQARLLAIMSIGFASWVIVAIIQWTAVHASVVHFSWELLPIIELPIYLFSLYFVATFLSGKDIVLRYKIIFASLYIPIIILLPTKINTTSFDLAYCQANNGPIWIYIYILEIIIMMIMSGLFIQKYFTTEKDDIFRKQVALLSIGMLLFLGTFTATNILGDFMLIYEFNLIGPVGMALFMVLLTFMIVKFKTFNIKLIGAQALVVSLWFLIGSLLFVAQSTTTRVVAGATFILSFIDGYLLIRSVKKEIKLREQVEELVVDLGKANERLKILDKMKSEFVSIASHQLRSPLTSIRGYTSMLVEGTYGKLPERAVDVLKNISDSARFMAQSVEDYLNVSRIEAGNMKYELSDFSLKEQAEKMVDEMRQVVMKAGLVLLFKSDNTGNMIVRADIGKTRQVISNIIDNAMKYTPHGTITVIAHDDIKQKKAIITIQDTGIGMDEDTRNSVFNKFTRAKNANDVNTSGTGLGLYVAKIMVEKMGGTVWVESEGQGKGSVFHIEFPLV